MSRRLLNYSMDIPKAAVEPGPLRRMHCVVHSTIRGDMNLSSRDVSGPVSLDMRLKVCKVAMRHCERLFSVEGANYSRTLLECICWMFSLLDCMIAPISPWIQRNRKPILSEAYHSQKKCPHFGNSAAWRGGFDCHPTSDRLSCSCSHRIPLRR